MSLDSFSVCFSAAVVVLEMVPSDVCAAASCIRLGIGPISGSGCGFPCNVMSAMLIKGGTGVFSKLFTECTSCVETVHFCIFTV